MAQYYDETTNYSLRKPHADAPVNIGDLNWNMDKLDTEVKANKTAAEAAKSITDRIEIVNASSRIKVGVLSDSADTSWSDFGGTVNHAGLRTVRNQAEVPWAAARYSSGLMIGLNDSHFYIGGSYGSTAGTVAFAGGSSSNSSGASPYWNFKIRGEGGQVYDLRTLFPETLSNTDFNAALDSTNTVNISGATAGGFLRKAAGMCSFYLTVCLASNTAASSLLIFTIPTGYKPYGSFYTSAYGHQVGSSVQAQVVNDGRVLLWPRAVSQTNPRYSLIATYPL